MTLPELSPESEEMLIRYSNRIEFKGDIKLALETMIKETTQAYKKIAEDWKLAKQKRLEKEDQNFRKTHSGFRKHKDFGY